MAALPSAVRVSHCVRALLLATTAAALAEPRALARQTTRASVDSSGAQGFGASQSPSISLNGQFVAFNSFDPYLAGHAHDRMSPIPFRSNIFVHDLSGGATELVSVRQDGEPANESSYAPAISGSGRYVAFMSYASNLVPGDTNACGDLFLLDRWKGFLERFSVDSMERQANAVSAYPSISGNGEYIAFSSYATNLVPGDTNGALDVFVRGRALGFTQRVSLASNGQQANLDCLSPSMSGEGRYIAFDSASTNLVPGDTNSRSDVFVHDRWTATTVRVSVDSSGAEADGDSSGATISADGQFVAFTSFADNLVAGDTNGTYDVFVHDLGTGKTERVSVGSSGSEANGANTYARISWDGTTVAFDSSASNLVSGDTNGADDVFAHDRTNGSTARMSVDSSGAESNGSSAFPSISKDGAFVAFQSDASNLVGDDTNRATDVFVRARCAASWSNYGTGFPGTRGIPTFTSRSDPVLGTTITLDLANSRGAFTYGLLLIGLQRTQIQSSWGGDLLVAPILTLSIAIPAGGVALSGSLPADDSFCGVEIDLQALELDPGAAKDVSFTPGLALVLGH